MTQTQTDLLLPRGTGKTVSQLSGSFPELVVSLALAIAPTNLIILTIPS